MEFIEWNTVFIISSAIEEFIFWGEICETDFVSLQEGRI